MFEIYDAQGRHLCWQKAKNESQAVEFARMYGHRAHSAKRVAQ